MEPQEMITIFRKIKSEGDQKQWTDYPELHDFFKQGLYIEDFKQTMISADRYMITFSFRRYSQASSSLH